MNPQLDDEYSPKKSSSCSPSPVRHHACERAVAQPHNIASTLASFCSGSNSSCSSLSPLIAHARGSIVVLCVILVLELLSVSCSSSEASPAAAANFITDDASSWPINVDSLFAPLDEIQQQDQSPHPVKSHLNFDVFDPSLANNAAHNDNDDMFSGAPDFNVMSTTSVAGGALVSWDPSSTTSYSVTVGQNVSITAQFKVTDLTGSVIQVTSIGTTSVTISVPAAYGTLSMSSSSGLTFSTAQSKVSTLTFTGNYVAVEAALTSLVFASNATVGAINITYSISFASLSSTSFSLAVTMNIAAIPTPTTVTPTTPAPATTAAPTVAPGAIRVAFSLGNVTFITVTASHPYLLQQHRAMLQAVLAHFTTQASQTLFVNTTAFNLRLQADICSACNISAAYCNTTNPTPANSRVIVIATEYSSTSQSTQATVDFNAATSSSTSSSSSSAGPSTALALLTVFESSTSLSSYSTLAHASVSSISITCALNGITYLSVASYESDCSSSSGVQWYVPVIVVVVVIGVLGIVVGIVLFARNWKKRQQLEQKNQALVGEDEASPVAAAPSNTTSLPTTATTNTNTAAATAAATPSPASAASTTTATAGVNSGVVTATGLVPAATTTAAPTPAAPTAAGNVAAQSTPSSPPVSSGGEVEMMPTSGEYPGVQPGLKFMYSAPDWEPDADEQGDGVAAASEIHLDLDAPTGSTMPRLGATLDDNSSARFSYVPRDS